MSASATLSTLSAADAQFATADFDPDLTDWSFIEPLVIGAGGIGCELLHLLALSGFAHLTVIDMDFIELSNLNRQFLFTQADIGKSKSAVAAAAVMARCPNVDVTAVVGKLEDQPDGFYAGFDVILLAVDSIPARRWINRKVAQLASRTVVPVVANAASPSPSSAAAPPVVRFVGTSVIDEVKPIIDTGTEGFEGHCRMINLHHNTTPCIECEMYLYNDGATRKTVPLCTLESVPRAPEHCVLYVQMKEWAEERGSEEELDPDNAEHVRWVSQRARARQTTFGIGGAPIDDLFTLGVIKNVVPAVGFTNAYVAGQAVTETLKWLTGCAPVLDNFAFYNGATETGVFTDVQRCCGAPTAGGGDVCGRCLVCGPLPVVAVHAALVTPSELVTGVLSTCLAEAGKSATTEEHAAALTASLRFQSNNTIVEMALPSPALPPCDPSKSREAEEERQKSVAAWLSAAGHAAFVQEWENGAQTAMMECVGWSDNARLCAIVQWDRN